MHVQVAAAAAASAAAAAADLARFQVEKSLME